MVGLFQNTQGPLHWLSWNCTPGNARAFVMRGLNSGRERDPETQWLLYSS